MDLWSPAAYRVCGRGTASWFLALSKASGFPPYPQVCAPNAEIQRDYLALESCGWEGRL